MLFNKGVFNTIQDGGKWRAKSLNPYKIEVMIISVIEMIDLPNRGHMNTSTIKFESSLKCFLYTFILRRPRVAKIGDIIKIATKFIKTTFKDWKKF